MPENNDARQTLELAAVTGAHGVSGEVRLKLFGEGVEALSAHSTFIVRDTGGELTLKKIRSDNKGGAVARFAECSGRTDAEKMRGSVLTVSREELPPLETGEYYHADLIGLSVVTDTGSKVGKLIAIQNFGATDVIEIEKDPVPAKGMKTFMVPMTDAAVIEWDVTRLVIAADFAED
ncbi:ribosome maturation factor RimM [Erythrobacter crassostreae]|uniref:Ribosome maturation factor RimM n=1 Tax=Erythrobacter crassostreae TaxID=2828328 RepID=A0A9X1JN62_9SPHN|nr:ribosome maturation factor RimM [Erythrobacter crassostrea]MBV7260139.1 16S rRNA processing protein RimM [Erythrobacter crassostrea]